jgi:cytochrome c2
MTSMTPTPAARGRSPLVFVFGGCAVLGLCVALACAANAAYGVYATRTARVADGPAVAPGDLATLPAGDAARGEQVFADGGCNACHSLEPGERIVGPSLAGVAARAASLQADYTAERYLYESIVSPNAHVAAGFPGGVMPANYGGRLSDQQLADLLAFLLTR